MLAFTITVDHPELGPPRDVEVRVYERVAHLRAAAQRYDNTKHPRRRRRHGEFAHTLGVCHRFEWINTTTDDDSHPLVAIVRLAKPHIGVGIISHELAHAAVWLQELAKVPLTTDTDEPFCWVLGDLVRQTVNTMQARGAFD